MRHALDAGLGELTGEGAELLGELHPGGEPRRLLGGDVGEVDGVGDGALEQVVGHLLGHLQGDVLLRLAGGGAQVRRADDVGETEQRAVLGRLHLEHVEGGAADMAGLEGRGQRALVDQAAARAVDDAHALLGLGKRCRVDDVAGLVGERGVQGDEIGAAQQVVELHLLHAQLHGALGRQEGIEGDHLHLQADGAVGDDGADVAAADHAQRLGVELDAQELRLLPLAALGGAVGLGDLAGERHHQRDGVLGGGDGIAEGRVHDDDALGGGGPHIDVVDADAGAADHLELGGGGDDLLGGLGGGAHREAIVVADDLLQLVLGEADLHVGGDAALLEDVDGGGRELIGNEYAGGRHGDFSGGRNPALPTLP